MVRPPAPRRGLIWLRLEARYTWRQYANYLHRQLFVLDTYANRHNRLLNHTMMAVHAWASAAWAASALLGAPPQANCKEA